LMKNALNTYSMKDEEGWQLPKFLV
jgi:hypothetical protein